MNNSRSGVPEDVGSTTFAIVVQCIFYGGLAVTGIMLNTAIIWLVYKKPRLQTVTNMWVASLCVSQLLTCTFSLPFVVTATAVDDWLLGSAFCQAFGFYTFIFRTVSIFSVAGTAINRYHVITRPFGKRMQADATRKFVILSWWSATVTCIPPLLGFGQYRYSSNGHICGISWIMGGASLVYSVFFIFSVYVATGLATVSSYFLIHKVTKLQAQKRRKTRNVLKSDSSRSANVNVNEENRSRLSSANSLRTHRMRWVPAVTSRYTQPMHSSTSSTTQTSADSRATRTIVLVLAIYICCWSPYFAHALILGFSGAPYNRQVTTTSQWWEFAVTWLSMSTCVWDPLLYGACTQNFKDHFRSLLCCLARSDCSKKYATGRSGNSQSVFNSSHASRRVNTENVTVPENQIHVSGRSFQHVFQDTMTCHDQQAECISVAETNNFDSPSKLAAADWRNSRKLKSGERRQRLNTVSPSENESFVMDDAEDVAGAYQVNVSISNGQSNAVFLGPTAKSVKIKNESANETAREILSEPINEQKHQFECLGKVTTNDLHEQPKDEADFERRTLSLETRVPQLTSQTTSSVLVRPTFLPLSPQSLESKELEGSTPWERIRAENRFFCYSNDLVTTASDFRRPVPPRKKRVTRI